MGSLGEEGPGRKSSKGKGPEAETQLVHSRDNKKANEARVGRASKRGDKLKGVVEASILVVRTVAFALSEKNLCQV
jgi:hypothetical protein